MLGSINTGGFFNQKGGKSLVDAMRDSNYFERKGVEGVYEPRNTKAPVVTGSFKGDSKGFLDKFKEGALSNLEKSKDKSDTDKYLDFMRETRDQTKFGDLLGASSNEVAEGLSVYTPRSTQQMFIPGQEGKGGFNPLGAVVGGIRGFSGGGGPLGAIGGGLAGGFM